jgi:hypothetical protein
VRPASDPAKPGKAKPLQPKSGVVKDTSELASLAAKRRTIPAISRTARHWACAKRIKSRRSLADNGSACLFLCDLLGESFDHPLLNDLFSQRQGMMPSDPPPHRLDRLGERRGPVDTVQNEWSGETL